MTSCSKPDFNKCCDLVKLTSLMQLVSIYCPKPVKLTACNKPVAFLVA